MWSGSQRKYLCPWCSLWPVVNLVVTPLLLLSLLAVVKLGFSTLNCFFVPFDTEQMDFRPKLRHPHFRLEVQEYWLQNDAFCMLMN